MTTHVDGSSGVDGFGTGNFIDLAIDVGAEDFYWTDAARGRIVGFSSSDGTVVVRDPASSEPRSIALLEAQERVVYSSDLPNLVNGVDEDLSNDFSASGVDDEIRGLATARTTPSSVANTAPTAIALEAMPVAENAPGAAIGRLTSSDPDAGDTASYAVVDDARFTIVGEELRLASGESLDFEATPSVEVEIVATDSGGRAGARRSRSR